MVSVTLFSNKISTPKVKKYKKWVYRVTHASRFLKPSHPSYPHCGEASKGWRDWIFKPLFLKPNSWMYNFVGVSGLLGFMRVLRLQVSVYNVYITNQFQPTFAQIRLWTGRRKTLKTFVLMTSKNSAAGLQLASAQQTELYCILHPLDMLSQGCHIFSNYKTAIEQYTLV